MWYGLREAVRPFQKPLIAFPAFEFRSSCILKERTSGRHHTYRRCPVHSPRCCFLFNYGFRARIGKPVGKGPQQIWRAHLHKECQERQPRLNVVTATNPSSTSSSFKDALTVGVTARTIDPSCPPDYTVDADNSSVIPAWTAYDMDGTVAGQEGSGFAIATPRI